MTEKPDSLPERVLHIERTFSARRERVYAAWTEGPLLRAWSCPEGLTVGEAWNDLRVGGRFLLEMLEPDSDTKHVATGRYLELDPPSRIVMTHGWLHEGEAPEAVDERSTHITVSFFEEGPTPAWFSCSGASRVTLRATATTRAGRAPSDSSTPFSPPRGRHLDRRRGPRGGDQAPGNGVVDPLPRVTVEACGPPGEAIMGPSGIP